MNDSSPSTCQILQGDALAILRTLPTESVDAVITDSPYSSGGFTRSDRNQRPSDKYQSSGTVISYGQFPGDNRDQRSWTLWSSLWMQEALRIVKPSGYLLTFTDWRQLPAATDAIQTGGWIWRGIVAWDKGLSARAPSTGWFRHQCEYIAWGTKGVTRPATHGGPWPGCLRHPVIRSEKQHMTAKPIALMRELVRIVPPGGTILDPFAGSGTTLRAALEEGRNAIGIEIDEAWFNVARQRAAA